MKLLVVGAQPNSLGAAIADTARDEPYGWEVVTAGRSRAEDYELDLVHYTDRELQILVSRLAPDHIVCTAGINHPREAYSSQAYWMAEHFNVNATGPMRLLNAWLKQYGRSDIPSPHFVAISSNSAVIPRSSSAAYCASKAALSMGLRVAARDAAIMGYGVSIYGYEPGLLAGTPMTAEVAKRFPNTPLTRMRGAMVEHGLTPSGLAGHIVRNLAFGGPELNGCLLRLDAGEV